MKDFILIGSIAWLAYYLGSKGTLKKIMKPDNNNIVPNNVAKPKLKEPNTDTTKKYVVVNKDSGTQLYAETGATVLPEYGNGRKPLAKVSNRTYLGMVTGKHQNNMIQVSAKINTVNSIFWVHQNEVVLLNKKQYDISKQNADIIDKTDETKLKLLQNS